MRDFEHFVITRFSVVFAKDQAPPSAEWLWSRLSLFEQTTVPAMESQTVQGFRWLVFFDDRVDESFRKRVDSLADGRFEPVWTSEFFDGRLLASHLSAHTAAAWVISSRVDNDDSLAIDYVETVQRIFSGQDMMYVNFVRGFQQVAGGRVYRYNALSNAFISLIERVGPDGSIKTVFYGRHFEALKLGDVLQVAGPPMWSQTIHGGNMMNQVRGFVCAERSLRRRVRNDVLVLPDKPVRSLLVDWLKSVLLLPRLWARQPRFFKEWARATVDLVRGTHTKRTKT